MRFDSSRPTTGGRVSIRFGFSAPPHVACIDEFEYEMGFQSDSDSRRRRMPEKPTTPPTLPGFQSDSDSRRRRMSTDPHVRNVRGPLGWFQSDSDSRRRRMPTGPRPTG